MESTGHLFAVNEIFKILVGSDQGKQNKFESAYKRIAKNTSVLRREGNYVYDRFLRKKIKEMLGEDDAFADSVIEKLGTVKCHFFSEKDFSDRCKDLKDAGFLSDDRYKSIDFGALGPTDVQNAVKELLVLLKEDDPALAELTDEGLLTEIKKRLDNDNAIEKVVKEDIREDQGDQDVLDEEDDKEAINDEIGRKKKVLKDFLHEIFRLKDEKVSCLDQALKDCKKFWGSADADKVVNAVKESLAIIKTSEHREISMRLSDMRYLKLAKLADEQGGDRDASELRHLENQDLKKRVVTENEVRQAEQNLSAVLNEVNGENNETEKGSRNKKQEEDPLKTAIKNIGKVREYFEVNFPTEKLNAIEEAWESNSGDIQRKLIYPEKSGDNEGEEESLLAAMRERATKRLENDIQTARSILGKDKKGKTIVKTESLLTNPEIREYSKERFDAVAHELEFDRKDFEQVLIFEGAIDPDIYRSYTQQRHHYPEVQKRGETSEEKQTEDRPRFSFKERMWKYISSALDHLEEAGKSSDKAKTFYLSCTALYDYAVFTHYYLDALVRRSSGDDNSHEKVDKSFKKEVEKFFKSPQAEGLKSMTPSRLHGNTKLFSSKHAKREAEIKKIFEDEIHDQFGKFRQVGDSIDMSQAMRPVIKIGLELYELYKEFESVRTESDESIFKRFQSWLKNLMPHGKSDSADKSDSAIPPFPCWPLEFSAPQSLEFHMRFRKAQRRVRIDHVLLYLKRLVVNTREGWWSDSTRRVKERESLKSEFIEKIKKIGQLDANDQDSYVSDIVEYIEDETGGEPGECDEIRSALQDALRTKKDSKLNSCFEKIVKRIVLYDVCCYLNKLRDALERSECSVDEWLDSSRRVEERESLKSEFIKKIKRIGQLGDDDRDSYVEDIVEYIKGKTGAEPGVRDEIRSALQDALRTKKDSELNSCFEKIVKLLREIVPSVPDLVRRIAPVIRTVYKRVVENEVFRRTASVKLLNAIFREEMGESAVRSRENVPRDDLEGKFVLCVVGQYPAGDFRDDIEKLLKPYQRDITGFRKMIDDRKIAGQDKWMPEIREFILSLGRSDDAKDKVLKEYNDNEQGTVAGIPFTQKAIERGMKYKDEGKYIRITGIEACATKFVTIPSHIEGKPVRVIGKGTFPSGTKRVRIPDTVETIEPGAFEKCNTLEYVQIVGKQRDCGDMMSYVGNASIIYSYRD